jgi:succinate dehydrogenase hydrophobic membrane anchor protein/succinate dehydrogenase cytochrome b556 subunit
MMMKSLATGTLSILARLPIISFYARTRGWYFVLSWCHRLTGILLGGYIGYHIYTLLSLAKPAAYDAKMQVYDQPIFRFLEWALAIPVIFHALNGGRLILYESFGRRDDDSMVRWLTGLALLYLIFFGILLRMENQTVSAPFYWMTIFFFALTLTYGAARSIVSTDNSIFWKLQRISAVYLLVMIPSHLVFMHLDPAMGKEAETVIARLQNPFIRTVDISLIVGTMYHAGYGVIGILRDFLSQRALRLALSVVVTAVLSILTFAALRLTVSA